MDFFYSFFSENLLLLHGDIETNSGPNKTYKSFSCCHWNVNSLTAYSMLKLSSIAAYYCIFISETYLDSSIQSDDRDVSINGYNLIRADHTSNNKTGGVCIYYQESLAVQLVKINYLNECLLYEVSFNNKKGYIAVLYRSPSQNRLELDTLISSFETILGDIHSFNPDFSIIPGDFNTRLDKWWVGDTQTSEGSQIDSLTALYGFRQLIPEPTHILKSFPSCIH